MSIRSAWSELRARLRQLSQVGYVRSVSVLVGGTAFAQAIAVLALPFIARLYTPADFSILAVFVSIVSIFSVIACFRLEVAISLPEKDSDAANLLALALCGCAIFSGISAIAVLLLPVEIAKLIDQPDLRPYLWLIPVSVLFAGSYSAFQFWATRKKRFGVIARTRMTQALGGAATQLGFGFSGIVPLGLLLGQTISGAAGLISLMRTAIHADRRAFKEISWSRMRSVLKTYERFPKYATAEAFVNTAGIQLPIVLIAAIAAGPEAGYLMLATRAMAMPMSLIGGAVAQVYLSRAPEELRKGNISEFSTKILSGLFKTGVGPLLFLGIIAPPLFSLLFGHKWERSGEIVSWMMPWFIFQFMSSPISMIMHVVSQQRLMLAVTFAGMLARIGAVVFAATYATQYLSEIYAISGGIFYFGCFFIFSRAAKVSRSAILGILRENLFALLAWIFFAGLVRLLFDFV